MGSELLGQDPGECFGVFPFDPCVGKVVDDSEGVIHAFRRHAIKGCGVRFGVFPLHPRSGKVVGYGEGVFHGLAVFCG